jgi:sucrose-6-phosphate hydrolase SacC (GH32 family)
VPVTEQWEAWNGTGGLVYFDGRFHLFHPCPSYNQQWPFTGIQLVTSRDGEHFTKQAPHPFMEGGDCDIYREESTGLFHMLKGGQAAKGRKKIVRLVSDDLRTWKEVAEPFMEVDGQYGVRTCPHLFGWNGRYYFMGGNTIWTSRNASNGSIKGYARAIWNECEVARQRRRRSRPIKARSFRSLSGLFGGR